MKDYVNEFHNYLVDKFWYSGLTGFIFSSDRKYVFFRYITLCLVNPSQPFSTCIALTTLAREITALLKGFPIPVT